MSSTANTDGNSSTPAPFTADRDDTLPAARETAANEPAVAAEHGSDDEITANDRDPPEAISQSRQDPPVTPATSDQMIRSAAETAANASQTPLSGVNSPVPGTGSGFRLPDNQPFEIGAVVGKCLLTERLGQGSAGLVFRALHQGLDIPVAVKVLQPKALERDRRISEHLKSEARLLAKLNHPNIIRVWDYHADPQFPYLVLELVEGLSLAELIQQSGRLRVDRAVEIITKVAEGLAAARRVGIIHRDVKPGNILLDKDGAPKLADLGQAVVLGTPLVDQLSGGGATLDAAAGTPAYMAPEQFLSPTDVDHRSDIYALGATLYHAVTGHFPFTGRSPREVILKHVNEMLTPPDEHVPDLDQDLSVVIETMMAKDANDRYQTYEELLETLQRVKSKETPSTVLASSLTATGMTLSVTGSGQSGRTLKAGELLKEAIVSAKAGNKAHATALLRAATELDPRNEHAWLWLAAVATAPHDILGALRKVLEINPANQRARQGLPAALLQVGIADAKTGKKDAARKVLLEAAELAPRTELAWLWLAAVTPARHEAVTYLQRVLEINPNNQHARDGIKKYQGGHAQGRQPQAVPQHGGHPHGGHPHGGQSQESQPEERHPTPVARKPPPFAVFECPLCGVSAEIGTNAGPPTNCPGCGAVLGSGDDIDTVLSNPAAKLSTLRQAVSKWEQTVRSKPDFASWTMLGVACLNARDLDGAVRAYREAAKLWPTDKAVARRLQALHERQATGQPVERGHVLVVDDSPTVRKMVALTLTQQHFRVTGAADGYEALDLMRADLPHLVLLDITMPGIDGYQLCKFIKADPRLTKIPVVMLSGKDGFFDKIRGRMVGSTRYLTKPFKAEVLIQAVEKFCLKK